jgi:hypothetical protein
MLRRLRKSRRKSRRVLRRRRTTRRAKRQSGGDIPDDDNALVSMRDGNDPDSVETVMSKAKFDEVSTASPESAAI